MELIVPFCRENLSDSDKEFVAESITHTRSDAEACLRLLEDPEDRDSLLDSTPLLSAILSRPNVVGISSRLYFYVLVRYVFRDAGLKDRALADYTATLLSVFAEAQRVFAENTGKREAFFYAVDVMAATEQAGPGQRFTLLVRLADRALFLTGLFPAHISARERTRAAPGMNYYETIGQSNYQLAGDHYIAQEYCLENIYGELGENFGLVRRALNRLSEHLVFLHEPPGLPGVN